MVTQLHAGRRALVTGANRGIGFGVARRLAREGSQVVLLARDKRAGEAAAAALQDEGAQAHFLHGDLRQLDSLPGLVTEASRLMDGAPELFCHAAGIYPVHELSDMTASHWDDVLSLNLTSAALLVKELLPGLTASPSGRVVMISSITGPRTGISGLSHYAASKGGLEAFVRAAAVELAAHGITVNAVAPGTIQTESLEALYSDPAELKDAVASIPVQRIGTPNDIAAAVSFLCSTDASFITGQSLIVDGGQTLPEV